MPPRPWVQRARRPLAAGLAAVVVGALVSVGVRQSRRAREKAHSLCHPNLSHLRSADGSREVLLIGTLPLDLDGASRSLVSRALGLLRPDVVMVEGTWTAGLNAMLFSGTWELQGVVSPRAFNWTDIGDAAPVAIPRPRPKGWLSFGGPPARFPERSLIPIKVRNWAHHLRGSVGGDVAAAVTSAASLGMPVRFLGPVDGGFQGHFLVSMLAQQALMELLEEEHQRGMQMPSDDVDSALLRAESHVKEDAGKWLKDAREETARLAEILGKRVPAKIREAVAEHAEERIAGTASRIVSAMEAFHKGAAVLAVDQLVGVEQRLQQAGYKYLSQCA